MPSWLCQIVSHLFHPLYHPATYIAAARALMSVEDMSAEDVATKAMNVAADMCVHTNKEFITHTLDDTAGEEAEEGP